MLKSKPQYDIWRWGVLGGWLGHEGRAFMNGISALIRSSQRAPLPLPPCEDTVRRLLSMGNALSMGPGNGPSPDTESAYAFDLGLPRLRNVRNKCVYTFQSMVFLL